MTVQKTITLYSFAELSDSAQEKALTKLWDLNVDYGWWDFTYTDAETIGLTITEFNLGNGRRISGKLSEPLLEVCKRIRRYHGKTCETYKTAQTYLTEYINAFKVWRASEQANDLEEHEGYSPADWLETFTDTCDAEEIPENFERMLLEDYLILLEREHDYLTSRGTIIEAIDANDYLFTESGSLSSL